MTNHCTAEVGDHKSSLEIFNSLCKFGVQCTEDSVQCTEYSVQCTEYSVQCTEYSVQCTVYSVQCTVYSIGVHDTVHSDVRDWLCVSVTGAVTRNLPIDHA